MNGTNRKSGRIRLLAGTLVAAAAVTVGGATAASAAPAAAPGPCTTADLAATLGPPEGAAGSVYQTLVLTDVGTRTCTVQGFPGVSYENAAGAQVGSPATDVGPPGGVVTLAPHRSAGAVVRFTRAELYDPAVCRPTPVAGLQVFPPGSTFALRVPRPGTGCANPAVSLLGVQTLAAQ